MSETIELAKPRWRGFRLTPQRLAILEVVNGSLGHLSAAEIFERASQKMPGLTEATIYRTLDFLVEQNLALSAHMGSGRIVYETAAESHQHLIFRKCGGTLVVDHHDLPMVRELLPRTVVMDGGHIVADVPTRQILSDPQLLHQHGLEMSPGPVKKARHLPIQFKGTV